MSNTKTFKTSELPKSIKALVALTGRRPRKVVVRFQSGPTKVYGAWRTNAKSFGKLVQSENNNWTGSDGEPNVSVSEIWDAPAAQDTTSYYSGAPVEVTVTIGNLRELCPASAQTVTADMLETLFKASTQTPVEATGRKVYTTSPGPFNFLTEDVVFDSASLDIQNANVVVSGNEHNSMLDQLGLN